MLDPFMNRILKPPLNFSAKMLARLNILPDQVTVIGFAVGCIGFFMIWAHWYKIALLCISINRILDGVDGALARQTKKTDAGGFLDICLDFIFYSLTVAGFAFADPDANALPAVVLILCFVGTGTSFLAFAAMAEKRGIKSMAYPHKSMVYMGGLTEGTETIIFMVLFCIFPNHFPLLAGIFSVLCAVTIVMRIIGGYTTLKTRTSQADQPPKE